MHHVQQAKQVEHGIDYSFVSPGYSLFPDSKSGLKVYVSKSSVTCLLNSGKAALPTSFTTLSKSRGHVNVCSLKIRKQNEEEV